MICEHAQTPLLKSTMVKAFDHWDRLRNHYISGVFSQRIEAARQEHWQMFEALRRRDFEEFVRLTREHNQAALAAYVGYMEANGYIDLQSDKDCLPDL
jgi:DNA-binding GntR family transcriptional regulator